MKERIAILGAGKLGQTLIRGLLEAGIASKGTIVATAKTAATRQAVQRHFGVRVEADNRKAAAGASTVIVSVKPQAMGEVLEGINGALDARKLVVSTAASVPTSFIEKRIGKPVPVVRTMPNTPCLLRCGMTAIAGGKYAKKEHVDRAERIFTALGRVAVVDERYMDAITGLSASGPAFLYMVIESLAEGGVKVGLPRELATELAAQTMLGAGRMVLETREHPAKLKDVVTTPAGCTIDGILELEEGGLRVALIKAVVRAAARAKELLPEQ